MDSKAFRKYGHELIDWIGDYYDQIEKYPVKSQVAPGEIFNKFEDSPPEAPQPFEETFQQFEERILPGITHWQHPNFHAFFPANTSFPSILGEILTSGLAAQCMIWETSPAAAELEEKVMDWLKIAMSLPSQWSGVIQDTASTSTLAALLVAREKKTNFNVNDKGFDGSQYRVYCSSQTHSSIDKAVKIAGYGSENLVKVDVDETMAMDASALAAAIEDDIQNGKIPCAVVTTLGTTGTMGMDPLAAINDICEKHEIWNHVDAAYAGNAFLLEEYQHYISDLKRANSYVFNPHKWLLVNFDCSVFFIKEKELLLRTFEILPEYLKTGNRGKVNDYRDWGIPLGRRFRALKLWMVIRTYGISGLKHYLRNQMELTEWIEQEMKNHPHFEVVLPREMNMLVFRFNPNKPQLDLNKLNEELLQSINKSGEAFLSHTKVKDQYVIRLVLGQTLMQKKHVEKVWNLIQQKASKILV